MGYAVSDNPPETADELLRLADEEMQRKALHPGKVAVHCLCDAACSGIRPDSLR
jgi:hypothetical protein